MRLTVRHSTTYSFDQPMRFVTQSHRLTPTTHAGQSVIDWAVTAEGATFGASFVDGAGDRVTTMTIGGPVRQIEVVVEGTVKTSDTSGILRDHRELIWPKVYLQPTAVVHPNQPLRALSEAAVRGIDREEELKRSHALSEAVAEAVAYQVGATEAHHTAAEVLERGQGVCQDMAHVLISAAQLAGLPARYVTGYLLTGEGAAGPADSGEAAHAWAEIHVASLGWIGFDPANRCCPDDRYVRLGSGRDAGEAAPIRGISRGGGGEVMDVSVAVAQQ